MDSDQEITKFIDDLRQSVIVAEQNYEIWWVYKEKESREKYVDIMNRYTLFFQTSIHAHFVALLVALYRIYENRKGTIHVNSLIKQLEKSPKIDRASINEFEEILDKIKPLWVKISTLRNEAFGHRSEKYSVAEVFERASVSPDELKHLIELTKELINKITLAWNQSTHAFNLNAGNDVQQMLEDLKNNGN